MYHVSDICVFCYQKIFKFEMKCPLNTPSKKRWKINHIERNKILDPVEGWNQMVKYNKLANVDGEEILM